MGDELNDDINRRRKPVPVPLYDNRYDNRYIERPYLRKHELSKIRDNLDELVEIKTELTDKNVPIITSISLPEIKTENKSEHVKPEIKNETVKTETKKEDVKFGISNLTESNEKSVDNKQSIISDNKNKQIENIPKIVKRKVFKMSDEEQPGYNISPEDRRRMRKAEIKEFHEEDESNKNIRRAAELAEQNKKELEEMKKTLAAENAEIRKELKNEFGNKFNDLTGKFDKVSGKLEETCTGIECLKKDLANISKNSDLSECPECGQKVVPRLASFCPNCSTKISGWTEDDGTPIKGWKPNWEK